MKGWETLDAIERQPDKVSGAWVFRGTRVPVTALFENLRDGATVDEFLEWFPLYKDHKLIKFVLLSIELNWVIIKKFL
ncbi:DUF433 domain-containing protein [Anabaena sp. FACHB-1391]|uniref:DUF433 domain-containing protein n=1 Tax=Anabaena sp. FACHB-1391 TaxID=2692771 RepID=UPI001F54D72C|nr:DUF433 domain-containing protein [Anabaena sp. FACHB-1391]